MHKLSASLALGLVALSASLAGAHEDDRKLLDRIGPYVGPGWTQAQRGTDPGFTSSGIQLQSWLTLADIGGGSDGSDIWGYVSPSGREYALMGHFQGTTVVEVTDPANPVVIDMISGPANIWRDIKVYQEHAYIVSEGGSGVQVIDLGGIDLGIVTLVNNANDSGTTATHNVAINEQSGFLYRCGGSSNGLRIYDLADPANPTLAAKLLAADGRNNDDFGWSVDLDLDDEGRVIALIGARTDDDAGPGNGSAYFYDVTSPGTPLLLTEVLPAPVTSVDTFGWAVALDGGTALVGAPGSDDLASSSGSVAILEASAGPSPCNEADLAGPFGLLDLADISAFVTAFTTGSPAADLNDDELIDLADISLFVVSFTGGCP